MPVFQVLSQDNSISYRSDNVVPDHRLEGPDSRSLCSSEACLEALGDGTECPSQGRLRVSCYAYSVYTRCVWHDGRFILSDAGSGI